METFQSAAVCWSSESASSLRLVPVFRIVTGNPRSCTAGRPGPAHRAGPAPATL